MKKAQNHSQRLVKLLRKFDPKLSRVDDAKEDLDVHITAKDVSNSIKKDMNNCALAVASKRELHPDMVIATRSRLYLIKNHKALRYDLTERIRMEITSFDRGAEFTPGTYNVKAPPPTARLGRRPGRQRGRNTGTKPRSPPQETQNIRVALRDV